MTTTDNVRGVTSVTNYTYTPVLSSADDPLDSNRFPPQVPVESTIQYLDYNSSLLRTINKWWNNQFQLSREQTILENGQSSQQIYTYAPFSQLKEEDEYDYGGNSPSRKTIINYQTFSNTPGTIADQPCQRLVYDINNQLAAETDYFYDNGTVTCGAPGTPSVRGVSGLVAGTHDETLFGTSSSISRGDLTRVVRRCFQGSQSCSSGSATTTYTYDETGQVLTKADPCGNASCSDMAGTSHTTTYSYTDSFTSGGTPPGSTDAYVTQITYPSTNGVSHTENFSYDYGNGQLTLSKDQDGQSTTYAYNDPFARPTQINYPDGGQVTYTYNDAVPSVTKTTLLGAVNAIWPFTNPYSVQTTVMDGLGHTIQTQLNTDIQSSDWGGGSGTDYVDTAYDGLGHIASVSNAYRSTSDAEYGFTYYTYDGLGRVRTTTEPDNSVVGTVYSGNCSTVTDEAGAARTSCSDGLGRLTGVWEDPTDRNYETDYTYDALDDLTGVNQKGDGSGPRVRSFLYDSLSRLTQATNPESGTINYTYDANGNLSMKVAPHPNPKTSGSVTTNYFYDALNRLTQKSYTGMTTAGAQYGYDGVAASGCTPPTISPAPTNLIGRRTSMCDASGATAWSYDPMGRINVVQRTINGVSKKISYVYNLDGHVREIVYPSGDTDWYGETIAGRIWAMNDQHYTMVPQNTLYTADGSGITSAWRGGGGSNYQGIYLITHFNKRMQPTLSWVRGVPGGGAPLTNVISLCYDFHTGGLTTVSDADYSCTYSNGTPADNGNVYQIQNLLDGNRTQNFDYDSLNRIQEAYTSGPDWGETYTIDPWGNLTNRGAVTGKTMHEHLNAAPATNNQLTGFTYDAAGNDTRDAFGDIISYDAENRIVKVAGVNYTYDGDGNRVEKSTGTLYWPGADGNILAESDLSGNLTAEYFFFNGQRIARVDYPSLALHYYFGDQLGSARVVTDAQANIQEESDYYPYGGEIPIISGDPNHYKFTGKERDSESNLDMFGARYYGSSLGRFMTPDWSPTPEAIPYGELSNPQSLNRYAYVKNNPTTLTDPDGHCDIDGEHHGWLWCAAHAIGFTQTVHEQAENARFQLSFFGPFYRNGQAVDLQKMSDKDVIQFQKDFYIANALGQVRTIDANSVAGVALTTASQIANGHAWTKHQGEFPGWDKGKFESTVSETMQNPDEVKSLSNNRTAYWNSKENMVVIKDPANADGGTAFRPTNGKAYFDGLK